MDNNYEYPFEYKVFLEEELYGNSEKNSENENNKNIEQKNVITNANDNRETASKIIKNNNNYSNYYYKK